MQNGLLTGDVSMTICAAGSDCHKIPCVITMKARENRMKVLAIDRASFNQGMNAQYDISIDDSGIAQTLVAKVPGAVAIIREAGEGATLLDSDNYETNVRRLTPLECCRLQGMPDWWCDEVPHKDAPEYKMWGNGMALPCAMYVMEGCVKVLTRRWPEKGDL